ncbi:transposase [Microcystis aeruginosa NIES-3804]|uniref:Transposase n=1 Tax=Microcystis aeruginosa NIES-3804 TaxID=2517783 RepID=A0A6H9GM36_MICAE|nr:hypothetical protein [Microcystis aeruginosa]GCL48670.1 transposase [Microcystis aeruginosa NIES-3804]
MRILSTNTDGQSEFQAWGETVRLVGTCTQKRVWGESRIPRHSVSLTAGVSINMIKLPDGVTIWLDSLLYNSHSWLTSLVKGKPVAIDSHQIL